MPAELEARRRNREIFGWCMFDFANSSYTTVIISVIYCDVYTKLIVPPDASSTNPFAFGNALWAWSLAFSYLFVVVSGPILGAITDFSSFKKIFLFISYIGCVIATFLLYYVEPGAIWLGFFLVGLSNFFFASGENIASSFLPFLGTKDELGRISGYAWGIGYFGGIGSVILVSNLGQIVLENFESLRFVGPYTAIFFLVAAIPTFLFLREPRLGIAFQKPESYWKTGIQRVIQTIKDASKYRDLVIFLFSLFFAMAALAIVITFAFIYGSQVIQIEDQHRQAMFVFIQVSAAIGALAFGLIQDSIGAKRTFNITLILWILTCGLIYFVVEMTNFLNASLGFQWTVQWVFVGISSMAGLGLGATQSASRAIVGLFAPEGKSGEFFGLWGLSGKIASAAGLFIIGFVQSVVPSLRDAFLVVSLFYLISLVINLFVNEARGKETSA